MPEEEEKGLRFEGTQLIKRAENLIDKNRGVLYKSSIGILKRGLIDAREKEDFSDLKEFLPRFEREYERMKVQFEREN